MGDVRRIDGDGAGQVAVTLDDLAREGARRMIAAALEAEVDEYVALFSDDAGEDGKRLVVRDWFMIAEKDGETAAAGISIPDINQVLARMRGRILPTGWWHFLRKRRIINRVRIGFLGVKPEFQHTGIAAKLYIEHFETSKGLGGITGEAGWILETNVGLNRAMEALNGRVIKRFRMYERRFSNDTPPALPKDAPIWHSSSAKEELASGPGAR